MGGSSGDPGFYWGSHPPRAGIRGLAWPGLGGKRLTLPAELEFKFYGGKSVGRGQIQNVEKIGIADKHDVRQRSNREMQGNAMFCFVF